MWRSSRWTQSRREHEVVFQEVRSCAGALVLGPIKNRATVHTYVCMYVKLRYDTVSILRKASNNQQPSVVDDDITIMPNRDPFEHHL